MPPKADTTRQEVDVALLKKGDRAAFARFVETYRDMVFACCRTAGLDKDDCDDAAAETFLAAWQGFGRFNGDCKLSSWLWTIAWRKAAKMRSRKHPADLLDSEELKEKAASSGQRGDHRVETQEETDLLWQTVARLPQSWAAAVVLFYREDKSVAEIADILKIPANTVKTYLDRGRKQLYQRLGQYWKYYAKS